ncbi:hypothetical protein LXL04_011811 [Taraxacum kok-saghyz]
MVKCMNSGLFSYLIKGVGTFYSTAREEPGSDPFPHQPTTRSLFFSTDFQRLLQKSKANASSPHREFGTSFHHLRSSESGELVTPSPPTSALAVSGHQRLQPFTVRRSTVSILRRRTQTADKHFILQISFHPSELLQFRFAVSCLRPPASSVLHCQAFECFDFAPTHADHRQGKSNFDLILWFLDEINLILTLIPFPVFRFPTSI